MKFLDIEYPKYNPAHKPWINGLFSAIVVLFIFLLFQPFGMGDKELVLKLTLFPVYSLLAYFYSIANFLIVRHILKSKKIWTVKNELLSFAIGMLPVTFLVHLLSIWITGDMPFSLYWYFKLLYHVSSLFLVIAVVEFLYYTSKSADIKIEHLSSRIQLVSRQLDSVKKESGFETVSISLEKVSIEINRNKVVFIKSIGNYLEFFFRESNGQIKRLVKRGRMHEAEKVLEAFPEFLRCHRAFIVNLKQAKQIKGNSKNARLVFDQTLKEQLDKIIAG
ncbi:MAG: LytTR family DNA-binding domain-containing protein [Bacteroidia bacterium]|nr:LytTR family DNA-binding domain-containing protein [Bacteroidia bacterium]